MPYQSQEKHDAWLQRNRERLAVYKQHYHAEHREHLLSLKRVAHAAIRLEALQHYSGAPEPECKCCQHKILRHLTLDHVVGGGGRHCRTLNIANSNLPRILKRQGWPDGYQVLYWNCNCAKKDKDACPHQIGLGSMQLPREVIKEQTIRHYSDNVCACANCGTAGFDFLTIDHIDGGGKQHRSTDVNARRIYYWLRNHEFPLGYRVLCWNCNCAPRGEV